MILLAVAIALAVAFLLARFTNLSLAVVLMVLAYVLLPLSLTEPGFNGITLLGVLAAVLSIALFIGAPSETEHRP